MDHPNNNIPSLENVDAITTHLESSLDAKKLTIPQKVQVLRDLMASDFGMNQMFYDACQRIASRLQRESFDLPTVAIQNARSLLAHSAVLSKLQAGSLQSVVGGDIAFRVNCIEELRRLGRTDVLLKQVGHLDHWREGQTMIQSLLSVGTPEQLFQVLMRFIQGKFSNHDEYHFGSDIYREESIDALFSAVITRAGILELTQISSEFEKGADVIGLPPEQFSRYASSVAVIFTASKIKHELSGLIDMTHSPAAHPESSAFWVPEVPVNPPTKINRSAAIPFFKPASLPPRPESMNATFSGDVYAPPSLPPRGPHVYADSESFELPVDGDSSNG